ncbi:Holliday junction resolvase RuvX [Thermovibrio sp.]
MRIMALDVGFKKIGIALSDPLLLTASPYKVLYRRSNKETFSELLKIINEKEVKEIVVGIPVNSRGEKSKMGDKIEKFTEKFKAFLKEAGVNVKVLFRDESFTTQEARALAKELGKEKEEVDDFAAALLLREYLEELQKERKDL